MGGILDTIYYIKVKGYKNLLDSDNKLLKIAMICYKINNIIVLNC